jgi:hypothetical protein
VSSRRRRRHRRRLIPELHAYAEATDALEILAIEQFVAIPELRVGGTLDRIYHFAGLNIIGDLKTGNSAIAYPDKLAKQLGTYANGTAYTTRSTAGSPGRSSSTRPGASSSTCQATARARSSG